VARHLTEVFSQLGLAVEYDDSAPATGGECGNLICRLPGSGGPPMLLAAHLDTIGPTAGIEVVEEKGVFRARGGGILGADDRAGVAIMVEVARVLRESGGSPLELELLFPVSEEVGLRGSHFLTPGFVLAKYGFSLDLSGPIGSLVNRAPFGQKLEIAIRGKAAHAGLEPEAGINAIALAAAAISGIRQGRLDELSTANIGMINGGEATNIVPDLVHVSGEARSLDEDRLEKHVESIREIFLRFVRKGGGDVEFESRRAYPGFFLGEDSLPVRVFRTAAARCGLPFLLQTSCGASDANFLNGYGIETVNLSVGMTEPHTSTEHIHRSDILAAARLVLELILVAAERLPPE